MIRIETVSFPAYRNHKELISQANNAMMALLAGSQLASNTLELTRGSKRLLPEIFPEVAHISRINLRVSDAADLLQAAETHLGAMAVPYALALHEDFVFATLDLLRVAGLCGKTAIEKASAKTMHELFASRSGTVFQLELLEEFHVLRLMRNSLIHAGGAPSEELTSYVSTLAETTLRYWEEATGRDIRAVIGGDSLAFGHRELITSLAITRRLAKDITLGLQRSLPREAWADVVVADFVAHHGWPRNPSLHLRKLSGWARHYYAALALSETELEEARHRIA